MMWTLYLLTAPTISPDGSFFVQNLIPGLRVADKLPWTWVGMRTVVFESYLLFLDRSNCELKIAEGLILSQMQLWIPQGSCLWHDPVFFSVCCSKQWADYKEVIIQLWLYWGMGLKHEQDNGFWITEFMLSCMRLHTKGFWELIYYS